MLSINKTKSKARCLPSWTDTISSHYITKLGFILWGEWISIQNPVLVEIFQSGPKDICILWRYNKWIGHLKWTQVSVLFCGRSASVMAPELSTLGIENVGHCGTSLWDIQLNNSPRSAHSQTASRLQSSFPAHLDQNRHMAPAGSTCTLPVMWWPLCGHQHPQPTTNTQHNRDSSVFSSAAGLHDQFHIAAHI